jgi:hypothetical protein
MRVSVRPQLVSELASPVTIMRFPDSGKSSYRDSGPARANRGTR